MSPIFFARRVFYRRYFFPRAPVSRTRFDITFARMGPDSYREGVHYIDRCFDSRRTEQTSVRGDFFLSTSGNSALGRVQSWVNARRVAGFS